MVDFISHDVRSRMMSVLQTDLARWISETEHVDEFSA